jgi:hypothetical protein
MSATKNTSPSWGAVAAGEGDIADPTLGRPVQRVVEAVARLEVAGTDDPAAGVALVPVGGVVQSLIGHATGPTVDVVNEHKTLIAASV